MTDPFLRRFVAPQGGARDHFDVKRHVTDRAKNAAAGSITWFLESLRDGRFADGGYPKFWVTSDGATLSFQACKDRCAQISRAIRENSHDGWRVVACCINWEDSDLTCDDTGERIPSAHGTDA